MYQDHLNKGSTQKPLNQNPDNQESLAGHWQCAMDEASQHWDRLTEADIERARQGRDALIAVLQERYGFSEAEADHRIEAFLDAHQHREKKKGFFERLTEMNGSLKVNQYVNNPAPGPSARDDDPPSLLPPES